MGGKASGRAGKWEGGSAVASLSRSLILSLSLFLFLFLSFSFSLSGNAPIRRTLIRVLFESVYHRFGFHVPSESIADPSHLLRAALAALAAALASAVPGRGGGPGPGGVSLEGREEEQGGVQAGLWEGRGEVGAGDSRYL